MRILAFDTATRATSVAWLDTDQGVAVEARDDPEPRQRPRHTTRLMSLVKEVLDGVAGGWEAVDRIAVGLGPGTFTGLRIGVATARALARAREIPLVGVSTLESLALGASSQPAAVDHDVVLAVLDARRAEVFAAAWPLESGRMDGASAPLLEPLAIAPDELAKTADTLGQRRLAIGDGAVEFRAVLERLGTSIPESDSRLHRVGAIYHCRLAASLPSARGEVWPQYLRLPDAELSLRATSQP